MFQKAPPFKGHCERFEGTVFQAMKQCTICMILNDSYLAQENDAFILRCGHSKGHCERFEGKAFQTLKQCTIRMILNDNYLAQENDAFILKCGHSKETY